MGKVKKSEKYDKIIKLMLQDVPTDQIAKMTGYSIHTIRNMLQELRLEYGVNSKVGIASAYINDKISEVSIKLSEIASITGGVQIDPAEKRRRGRQPAPKSPKK